MTGEQQKAGPVTLTEQEMERVTGGHAINFLDDRLTASWAGKNGALFVLPVFQIDEKIPNPPR